MFFHYFSCVFINFHYFLSLSIVPVICSIDLKLPPFLYPLGYDRNGGFKYEVYFKRKTSLGETAR